MCSGALKAVIYTVIHCLQYVIIKPYELFVWIFVYYFYYRIIKGKNTSFEDKDSYVYIYWLSNFRESVKEGNFFKSIPLTIFIFELIGLLIVSSLNINMKPDAWFYLFSTIPQVFSSLVALIAVFVIFSVNFEDSELKKKIIQLMQRTLKFPLILIALSFISIPFGSVIPFDDYNWLLMRAADWKLKWLFVFFVVGFCVSSLYKIYIDLESLLILIKNKQK